MLTFDEPNMRRWDVHKFMEEQLQALHTKHYKELKLYFGCFIPEVNGDLFQDSCYERLHYIIKCKEKWLRSESA